MKIITAETMQELDRQTIKECGIPGLQLMENAGRSCAEVVIAEFGTPGRCTVMAGKGNNGGDGYVIARLLAVKGWRVTVILLAERAQVAGDAALNLAMLSGVEVHCCTVGGRLAALHSDEIFQSDVIVDALFGTGLNSDVSGVYLEAVTLMNASGRPIVAVDIPSGVHGTTGRVLGEAVRAEITVTFALAKSGQILYPGAEYTGRLVVADIGIPPELMAAAPGYDFLDEETMRPLLRQRDRQAHKGAFGHCLVVAGSTGKTGAAALAANSAVRAGSGLVTVAVPERVHSILELKTTEAMTSALPDSGKGHLTDCSLSAVLQLLAGKDAVALGPGLGNCPGTYAFVQGVLEAVTVPLVLDADALNALAGDVTVLQRKKSGQVILTPHPGEMARLQGTCVADVEASRITCAREFARSHGVFLILKGARTVIASPAGVVAINGSGNPGMASGGMGDVLTGIIVSLAGQGYSAWDACCLGVFIHGFAANLVADEKGEIGITATDVLEMLPYAYKKLKGDVPC